MTVDASVILFVAGFMCAGFAVAGLFFLRFWARTGDGLFAAFAVAFWLMALNQAVSGISRYAQHENSAAYLLRLAAFCLIIAAVLSKGRRRS